MNGAVVVDKPSGWTSHDAVNRLRKIFNTKAVGHLGTLDPLATGVLPVLLNRATRLARFFTQSEKHYEAVVLFGYATDSYDADGTASTNPVTPDFSSGQLEQVLDRFRGAFEQTPPPVSAKKIAGRPAYKLARKNLPVDLAAVTVTVHELTLRSFNGSEAAVSIHCSAGTYVRAIAHEAGQTLGCGAHLKSLRRTQSGPFHIAQAHTLEDLTALASGGRLSDALVPAQELLPEFPVEVVDPITEAQIRNGREFRVSPFRSRPASQYVKALSRSGELIAIGEIQLPTVYHPVVVL